MIVLQCRSPLHSEWFVKSNPTRKLGVGSFDPASSTRLDVASFCADDPPMSNLLLSALRRD